MVRVNRSVLLAALGAASAVLLWTPQAQALPPDCGELIVDDALAGATLGEQNGGALDPTGFTPGDRGGSIVWNLDEPLRRGCVELTVEGFTNAGLGEHDFLELFTGPGGSFSDRAVDHFLLYKIAGDVFPDVDGAVKVELGLEFDVLEVGTWSPNLAWSPDQSYTLAIKLAEDGTVAFYRDDELLADVDYTPINGGVLDFLSVRIPNDGEYQSKSVLSAATYRNVRIYAHPIEAGGTTGGGAGDSGGVVDGTGSDESGTPGGSDGPDPGTTTNGALGTGTGEASDSGAGSGDSDPGGVDAGLPFDDGRTDGSSCACRGGEGGPAWPALAFLGVVAALRRTNERGAR